MGEPSSRVLEEELYDLDLIYGDDCHYEAYNYFMDVIFISDDDDVPMPPLEPWTPTKK
jgi:hypothetical protein